MSHYDWSKLSLKVDIRATPIAAYNAWATQSNLESWFLRKALFTTPDGKLREETAPVQPGDTYLWRWHGYDDKTQEKGKFKTGRQLTAFGICYLMGKVSKDDAGSMDFSSRSNGAINVIVKRVI